MEENHSYRFPGPLIMWLGRWIITPFLVKKNFNAKFSIKASDEDEHWQEESEFRCMEHTSILSQKSEVPVKYGPEIDRRRSENRRF